jgi:hypothetical protein
MIFLRLARKNKEAAAQSWDDLYETLIIRKIRQRYSVNQELAILRQRDSKPEEFTAYNEYVERCKAEVKQELGI